jgi:hypothetical protein
MEVSPLAIALISILGSILVCMLGLLITMVFGVRKDLETRTEKIYCEIKNLRERLALMVLSEDYKDDKQKIDVRLDEHGNKILRLEIKVINGVTK